MTDKETAGESGAEQTQLTTHVGTNLDAEQLPAEGATPNTPNVAEYKQQLDAAWGEYENSLQEPLVKAIAYGNACLEKKAAFKAALPRSVWRSKWRPSHN